MKTLDQLIKGYTDLLQQGEIQVAYRGILEFIGKFRAHTFKKYPYYEVSGIYQGYMDMSYFSIVTKPLKEKGLKFAIVYWHEKGTFEVWLSARNREISNYYDSQFNGKIFEGLSVFHDHHNQDAIIECTLTSSPNFDEQELLINLLEKEIEHFITAISNSLEQNS